MEYQLDGIGKYKYLENDNIIKAPTPRGLQLFRIYIVEKYINNTIKVYAKHIFYDLLMNNVNLNLRNVTADRALKDIISRAEVRNNFTASSNIRNNNSIEIENKDPVTAILGDEGFISLWGGELLRDNYNIEVNNAEFTNSGFKIIYRKNLKGLDVSESYENIITRVKPIARNIDDNPLYLPEIYVNSPNINKYPFIRLYVLECNDLRVGQDDLTQSQAFQQMRNRANEIFINEGDLPQINAKIEFQLLSQTEEYKEYKVLEKVNLGDIVTMLHKPLGVELLAKCIRYEYDCLKESYIKIELGQFKDNINNIISGGNVSNVTINGIDAGLTNHISNTEIHVSSEERNRWNNINNVIEVGESLDKHTQDKDIHISHMNDIVPLLEKIDNLTNRIEELENKVSNQ